MQERPRYNIIRLLIREVTEDLEARIMDLQRMVGAVEDGIWGPETQQMWTKFVMNVNPAVIGASLEDLTDQWGLYAQDVQEVNGTPATYRNDVQGALDFLLDITSDVGLVQGSMDANVQTTPMHRGEFSQMRVCILGDSHIASQFGISLQKILNDSGFDARRFGVGGASGRSWLSGNGFSKNPRTLAEVKQEGPYDVAIICLGTNDGANAHVITVDPARLAEMANESANNIAEVSRAIGAPVTFWVGPPGMTGRSENPHYQPEAMDHIYDAVTPRFSGTTFDSRRVDTGKGDHVHVYGSTATAWAQEVADFVQESLTYQIPGR